jgi:hypothetical protein
MGKTNFFLSTMPFSPWVVSATWLQCRSLENTGKINLKSFLNKTSPQAHMELEFDVFGVPEKLVKYVVHLSKRKYRKKIEFLLTSCPNGQTTIDQFLVSGNFRG